MNSFELCKWQIEALSKIDQSECGERASKLRDYFAFNLQNGILTQRQYDILMDWLKFYLED